MNEIARHQGERAGSLVAHDSTVVPVLIAAVGEQASWRFVEFFTANIRNPNTRRAYTRACAQFFAWCERRGLSLSTIRAHDMGAYIEELQVTHTAPTVKQQLAAVRMLFDWLVTGQVMSTNPAAAVRGPKHVVKTGKTPVLEAAEWRKLLRSIPTETVRDLRDRALIATLTYSFARIGAALKMKVEDLRPKGAGWQVRLHEKGGKYHAMPCHHALSAVTALPACNFGSCGYCLRTASGYSERLGLTFEADTPVDALVDRDGWFCDGPVTAVARVKLTLRH